VNPYIVLGSAVVGLLVGLTGAGGGALMTPMLILLFNVKPEAAISSDLVAAVVMRPVGSLVHMGKGTVNFRLVGWMCAGSVPMAFLGAWLLHQIGDGNGAQQNVETALGAALLAGTAAMVLRSWLDSRSGLQRTANVKELSSRPAITVLIGAVGGIIVGMTSVGSGSLMIVLLLFAYPLIGARQLVGTDLTQAVPLTAAAALGALAFGHVEFGLTTAVVAGSVPAVLIGSFLSSRAPDKYIRPAITIVIFASGLKYAGLGTTALGWTLCAVILVAAAWWLARTLWGAKTATMPPDLQQPKPTAHPPTARQAVDTCRVTAGTSQAQPSPCGCRKCCHPMRPAHIRGSGRRAGPGAERPCRLLRQADARVRRAAPAEVTGAAGANRSDPRTRRGPGAGAVRQRPASGPGTRGRHCPPSAPITPQEGTERCPAPGGAGR
jgi:hypothetical protein